MNIRGRAAIVTGGGAGIGRAISQLLSVEGASVLVGERNQRAGQATVEQIRTSGGRAVLAVADVSTDVGVREILNQCAGEFGPVEILVNNAGGVGAPCFPAAPVDQWSKVIDLNLRAPMLAIQLAVDTMRARGGGAIVNISSMAGVGLAPHGAPEYAAAKAALVRLTASLGNLGAEIGVRVNCICPGWVDTPASQHTRASMTEEELHDLPKTILSPDQIADLAIRLIRDDSLAGRVLVWPDDEPWRVLDSS